MIDFYTLSSEIKQHLLVLGQRLDVTTDPLAWAWVMYGFASDGAANNPPLTQALVQAGRWLTDDLIWHNDSNLGAIGLIYTLMGRPTNTIWHERLSGLGERVARLRDQVPGKFARLNDPDFTFGLAQLSYGNLVPELSNWLCAYCIRCAQSENLRRAVLFAAAATTLDGILHPLAFNVTDLAVHEVIPMLWLAECSVELIGGNDQRRGLWEAYTRLRDGIVLSETDSIEGALYIVNPIDLAMLYRAVTYKVTEADFVALFNNMPWHPAIRAAAGALFLKGEYVSAVFEAAKGFVDAVKRCAGNPSDRNGNPLDGVPLIAHVFAVKSPCLKFTQLSTQTEQNEHRGLALIAEGIVAALRNPKGHLPGIAITLTPEEALEQLATISYLMRRLEQAIPSTRHREQAM